jgi:uncharacterized protein YutE (UPF0331/DUF86 family)
MVDVNVISRKLAQLSLRMAKVRMHCPANPEDMAEGSDELDLVSFNLFLAVQTCVDLATHLIAEESWEPTATAREAFERLEERGVISKTTVGALRGAIGLRNIVAHGYSGVDPAQIHAAATTGLGDLDRFAQEVSVWVQKHNEGG